MTRIAPVSRAAGRLVSCITEKKSSEIGGRLFMSSGRCNGPVGEYAQMRCLSSIVRVENPLTRVNDNDKAVDSFFCRTYNAVQSRQFLGVGDGEEGNALSKTYEEKRLMGYSPEQLFAVVAAVDMYEDFLPWCQRSQILRHNQDGSLDAELEIGFKFLVESYVSHVEMKKPERIKSSVRNSSLFDHLINIWEFNPGPVPGTCDLYFHVDFKFQSPLYRQVASMFFKEVVARLVASFHDRCKLIYGPGVPVLENSYGGQRA